jgi:branched-chain amino acid transport system ATP-binding protein
MLEVRNLSAHYGRSQALFDVSLNVADGEAVAVLGANAAGKSTTLNCISRILRPSGGVIRLDGDDIGRWKPKRVVEAGAIQVPEGRQVFPFLTVLENLELGAYSRRARPYRRDSLETVYEWLPILRERRSQLAGTLSGGEQQMLAIGRAMMARPRLLMLDEPSLGLSPIMVQRTFATIAKLKETGITILLVEQNMEQALRIVDRAYVLNTGRTVLQATAAQLRADPEMRKAYLGIESVSEVVEEERIPDAEGAAAR